MARRGDGIYQRGKTWWLDFTHDGRRHVARLGKGINRTVAGELAQVKRTAILKGEAGIGPRPAVTVAEYAGRWIAQVSPNIATATRDSYQRLLTCHIVPAFGPMKLAALERGAVKALLTKKRAGGLSKNTVRLIRSTLSVMLNDAVDAGLLTVNPAHGLTRRGRKGPDSITLGERQKWLRPLSPEQLETFLARARGCQAEWTLFLTLADTGMRPSEALALRWSDFDAAGQRLTVERAVSAGAVKATKTSTARTVELTPRLVAALDRWQTECEKSALLAAREPAPWLFPGPDGLQNYLGVGRRFQRLLTLAGLPLFRLYDLRHSYATHLLAAGAPITYVAAQLGHAKATTTLQHYAHWIPTPERVWAPRLEAARVAIPNAFHNTPAAASPVAGVSRV